MEENYLKYKNEQLDIKTELATEKDWEAYKELRLLALSGKDKEIMGSTPQQIIKEKAKSEQEWKKDLSSDDMFVVLSWNGSNAIGMGRAMKKDEDTELWYMDSGYVKEYGDFRNKGIGKGIFKARLDEIKKRGGKKVFLGIKSNNAPSIHVAESFGFKKVDKDEDSSDKGYYFELNLTTKPKDVPL
jgi:RimJ/RimL family protein N-acetyltransferase